MTIIIVGRRRSSLLLLLLPSVNLVRCQFSKMKIIHSKSDGWKNGRTEKDFETTSEGRKEGKQCKVVVANRRYDDVYIQYLPCSTYLSYQNIYLLTAYTHTIIHWDRRKKEEQEQQQSTNDPGDSLGRSVGSGQREYNTAQSIIEINRRRAS